MIAIGILAGALVVLGIIFALQLQGRARIATILAVCLFFGLGASVVYSVRNLIFTSADKYRPLALIPVSEIHKGTVWPASFLHAYRGRYEVGFFVEKLTMDPVESYPADLVLEVRIYSNNTLCFSDRSGNGIVPFRGAKEKGFVFITYEAPRNVPIDQEIRFEAEVVQTNSRFVEQCGPRHLFVRKASDK